LLLALLPVVLLVPTPARAELPQRNLLVEVRVLDERDASTDAAGVVSSQRSTSAPGGPVQRLQVLNGTSASLQFARALPVPWLRSGSRHGAASAAGRGQTAPSPSGLGGALENEVTWLDAGTRLTLRPQWPGPGRPVRLELELGTAEIAPRDSAEMPSTQRQAVRATVLVPLGPWTTVTDSTAAAAPPDTTGSVSSQRLSRSPSEFRAHPPAVQVQVRILAP
jgi:hypothetical protein